MCQETLFHSLLSSALDQPAATRASFVRAASNDQALAEEVLQGLEEMNHLGDFLERPAATSLAKAA